MSVEGYTLYSGGARGAEAWFGSLAEKYGIQEVNYGFEGHQSERARGMRMLTAEELELKDVSLTYVSRLMNRKYSNAPLFRKVLQSICWQVASGHEVYVVGVVQADDTVKGGTGWGAEYAKICNKPLFVFDQERDAWFEWAKTRWQEAKNPVVSHKYFTGTGTRFLEDNGRKALEELFFRSFGK
ncbi:hypothetical protein GGQ74_002828 [Desulfobaculum xiamenense]|uniref:Uncharacterized protein n=1 Tax=Desulfobaculum xiamenense TaxID=995050 RepID=A0A846QVJ2_9BACT|nr:hypothetical protein [Desulfobaculum xiamenense]NJB69134.1 hypothetical protein [Desulfobaculum xiamenense]